MGTQRATRRPAWLGRAGLSAAAFLLASTAAFSQPAPTTADAEKFVSLMIPRAVTRSISLQGQADVPRTYEAAPTANCRTELAFVEQANGDHFAWVIDWRKVSAVSVDGANATVRGAVVLYYQGARNHEIAGFQFDFGDNANAERFRRAATMLRDACDPAKGLGF